MCLGSATGTIIVAINQFEGKGRALYVRMFYENGRSLIVTRRLC